MAEAVAAMELHEELEVTPQVRVKLLAVSAATIDRMLAPDRRRLRMKGRSGTKPGSILKRQIPIRTFAQWDERRPGFCEVDLVAHDGGSPAGEFCHTLDLTLREHGVDGDSGPPRGVRSSSIPSWWIPVGLRSKTMSPKNEPR